MAFHAYSLRAAIRILQPREGVTQNSVAVRFSYWTLTLSYTPTWARRRRATIPLAGTKAIRIIWMVY
jgi:hypothetical protein